MNNEKAKARIREIEIVLLPLLYEKLFKEECYITLELRNNINELLTERRKLQGLCSFWVFTGEANAKTTK